MALKVFWSPEAETQLLNLLKYLEENWGEPSVRKFAQKLDATIEVIRFFPEAYFLAIKSKNIRRAVIEKMISVYYRKTSEGIEIITLFDNRMDPKKVKSSLKKK